MISYKLDNDLEDTKCIRIPRYNKPHIWLDPELGWNFIYSSTIWQNVNLEKLTAFTKYMDKQRD